MLEPHPKTLRTLLARYAEARIAHSCHGDPGAARDLEDVAYTLCVLTATASVEDAIVVADTLLTTARDGRSVGAEQAETDLAA
ncbi:DUF5133 domain-containing protein [Streptomyces xanthochromogenes]|uniref:DUF5133 domain-containing protein n=1 Tax=Streptomyces xanthochromogenes TaxID=67384 RepID=UPI003415E935